MHKIKKHKILAPIIAVAFASLTVLFSVFPAIYAATTTPATINYQGRLLNSASTPLTGAYTFRFSLWSDADWDAGDELGSGAIDVTAVGYAGWQEAQSITVGAFGLFNMSLGSITPFPSFTAGTHDYLQVEVKTTGSPDTSYEVLDPSSTLADTSDRKPVHNQAYAQNADTIDNADVGTAAGDLAVLGTGGVWDIARIPAGTNADIWQIDVNDNAAGGVVQLSFGPALNGNTLEFDPDGVGIGDGWFDFSDDLNVQGDISVTGTVDGVDISNLQFTDIATRTKTRRLKPHFPGAVAEAIGGGGHRGKIESHFVDDDGAGGPDNFTFYNWTTRQPGTQDYDIVLRWRLPDDWVSWQATPIVFRYRTGTAVLADNDLDVTIEDTTGTVIGGLTGGSNLVSTGWTTTSIGFGGGGTFTAGSEITIFIKMNATSSGGAYVGDFAFNYNGR